MLQEKHNSAINHPGTKRLTDEEKTEAMRIRTKYRDGTRIVNGEEKSNMCSFGPLMDGWIAKALTSEKKRDEIRAKVEVFHNLTYVGSGEANNMKDGTFPLLGIDARQDRMEIVNCWLTGEQDTLSSDTIFTTILVMDKSMYEPIQQGNFFRVKKKSGKMTIIHKQLVELTFHAPEEYYLFVRAFWHYTEAAVACHALQKALPGELEEKLLEYVEARKSLIDHVVHVHFPRNKFPGQVKSLSGTALGDWYDKYFFSRYSAVKKKCLQLAGEIKDGFQALGKR